MRKEPTRLKSAAVPALAILSVFLPACVSASPPKTSAQMIGEAMYTTHPWADTEPVNITARMNAVQGALAAVGSAQQSYHDYRMGQAAAFNERAFLKAEYARYEAGMRKQQAAVAEAARLRALAEQDARSLAVSREPPRIAASPEWDSSGWDLGVAVAGWVGMQDDALRRLRVHINTQTVSAPPPPPPPRRYK